MYGLAEATLGVTFPTPGSGMVVDTIDRASLEFDGLAVPADSRAPARALPFLGRPLEGVTLRIGPVEKGPVCGDRCVGEIQVSGPSVTREYLNQPSATAGALHGGWLHTGDLGYVAEGQLVVCGRAKDTIIHAGRNIAPEEIEWAAGQVPGVRAGNVAAFGVENGTSTEKVALAAEVRAGFADDIRPAIVRAVRQEVGVTPVEVILLAKGSLPKTTSGKIQRSLCRSKFHTGELACDAIR